MILQRVFFWQGNRCLEAHSQGTGPLSPKDWNAIREFRTLPYFLKQKGYQTALTGKWYLYQPTAREGIDHWVTFDLGHTVDFWSNRIPAAS